MKVMYVDIEVSGHHLSYLQALLDIGNKENVLVLPERIPSIQCKQYVFRKIDFFSKKIPEYLGWIKEIREIAEKEAPDVIHFLYGDVFYKYFGLGLEGLCKKYKVVNTIHALKKKRIGILSLKRILKYSTIGVVHTEAIFNQLEQAGIKGVTHVEYPSFSANTGCTSKEAKEYFGISPDKKCLACIGSTRYDKGLDILLEALKNVKADFELLVAGGEDAFHKEEILKMAEGYQDRLRLCLKYLTDDELEKAFVAADIIVLPYRRIFNGASGPLGEGAVKEKMIIGPDHGSLGDIISRYHLGDIFESESSESLAAVLDKAIKADFVYDSWAKQYKANLSVSRFQRDYQAIYGIQEK